MNLISVIKFAVSLLFFFATSNVEGSHYNTYTRSTTFHEDTCLLSVFGPQENDQDMKQLILSSPMDKVIDGFIACPDQMCKIYYSVSFFQGTKVLVEAVKDSDKKEMFYQALGRNPQSLTVESKFSPANIYQELTRKSIYVNSFVLDIDPSLYLEKLKIDVLTYFQALMVKAISCKSIEYKIQFADFLQIEMNYFADSDSSNPADIRVYLMKAFEYILKLLRNDQIVLSQHEGIDFQTKLFIALGMNRFDIAHEIINDTESPHIDFITVANFYHGSISKYTDNLQEVMEFLKSLLSTETEKSRLEQIMLENDLEKTMAFYGFRFCKL